MRLEEREIPVESLEVGMWVCRLDRPWEGTPFLLQGLLIETRADVELLARYCKTVHVDIELSKPEVSQRLRSLPREAAKLGGHNTLSGLQGTSPASAGQVDRPAALAPAKTGRMPTPDDLDMARNAIALVVSRTTELFEHLREGQPVTREQIEAVAVPVVDNIARNQDAFLWLMALKRHSSYEYMHAMNCCALSAAFALELALPADRINAIAVGGLIMNIGMVDVPEEILNAPRDLRPEEWAQVRLHVESGLRRAQAMSFSDADTLAMVACHHERYDGTGYPAGLKGPGIPMAGRLAAIVDAFDAMCADRPHRRAISRSEALHELYRLRGTRFHRELVEEFVKCLGIYPVGSLVELNTGEVAIVMIQNALLRLRPRIMVLTDEKKQTLGHFHSIDLSDTREDASVHILRTLGPGAYGLDPTELFL